MPVHDIRAIGRVESGHDTSGGLRPNIPLRGVEGDPGWVWWTCGVRWCFWVCLCGCTVYRRVCVWVSLIAYIFTCCACVPAAPPRTANGVWTSIRRTDRYIQVGHYTTRVGRKMSDNAPRHPSKCSTEGRGRGGLGS